VSEVSDIVFSLIEAEHLFEREAFPSDSEDVDEVLLLAAPTNGGELHACEILQARKAHPELGPLNRWDESWIAILEKTQPHALSSAMERAFLKIFHLERNTRLLEARSDSQGVNRRCREPIKIH